MARNLLPSPNNLFTERLHRLRRLSRGQSCGGTLLTDTHTISYLTGYQGFSPLEREVYLLVDTRHVHLFTDGRYTEALRTAAPHITTIESTATSPFRKNLEAVLRKQKITVLGYEEDNLTAREFKEISRLTKLMPLDLRSLRLIKSPEEVALIRKACRIGEAAIVELFKNIPENTHESELAQTLEILIKKQNADISFPTIVAFGKNAALPHHLTGDTKLKKRDVVLVDFGVRYQGYSSDTTRTIFVGEPENIQIAAYEATFLAQKAAISYIKGCLANQKPVSGQEADNKARQVILTAGFPTIPHALGHGIGLAVHEAPALSPRSQDILTEGMVFSIEPGIYLPGKFGIRIEDLFAIQNGKLIQLTSPISKHIGSQSTLEK